MPPDHRAKSALSIASRIGAALLGGYGFVWGFTCLCIACGMLAGMPYSDAQTLAFLIAFLLFLGVFVWAFAARRVAVVWVALAGGGLLMTGLSAALIPGAA